MKKTAIAAIACMMLLSGAAPADTTGLPLRGPALHLLKLAGPSALPDACTVSGEVCFWYDSNANAFKLKLADGSNASLGTGSGSVTSVDLTVPSWLAVAGSPITSSGSLALSAATGQTANRILATPDGTTGAVGLRSLVASDLPSTAVTPGSYTSANITVDGHGLITGASDGAFGSVLEFNDSQNTHVTHGYIAPWTAGTNIGTGFWWEGWATLTKAGYLLADGGGGQHALLFGLGGADPGTTGSAFTGNVYDGSGTTSYGTDLVTGFVAAGEWFHFGVSWDGSYIRVYIDGVLSGIEPFAGPRQSPGGGGSLPGLLFVMGSDHSNSAGRVAWIRGYDAVLPNGTGGPAFNASLSFIPERALSSQIASASTVYEADFMLDFMSPGSVIPDRSHGYGSAIHSGARMPTSGSLLPGSPLPQWVQDPTCPVIGSGAVPLQTESVLTPPATPTGALAFDSFSRRNQTYAFQSAPSLGSTEAGSLGPLVWHTVTGLTGVNAHPYGILSGRAAFLGSDLFTSYPAWVDVGTADQDVRADRSLGTYNQAPLLIFGSRPGAKGSTVTGLVFRVQDQDNYWFAGMGAGQFVVGYVLAGATTTVDSSVLRDGYGNSNTDDFLTMRVVAKGTTIELHIIDGSGDRLLATYTGQTTLQTATGAGIGQTGQFQSDMTGLWRADNFTVFAAP